LKHWDRFCRSSLKEINPTGVSIHCDRGPRLLTPAEGGWFGAFDVAAAETHSAAQRGSAGEIGVLTEARLGQGDCRGGIGCGIFRPASSIHGAIDCERIGERVTASRAAREGSSRNVQLPMEIQSTRSAAWHASREGRTSETASTEQPRSEICRSIRALWIRQSVSWTSRLRRLERPLSFIFNRHSLQSHTPDQLAHVPLARQASSSLAHECISEGP
jgi:hypothetical protein